MRLPCCQSYRSCPALTASQWSTQSDGLDSALNRPANYVFLLETFAPPVRYGRDVCATRVLSVVLVATS